MTDGRLEALRQIEAVALEIFGDDGPSGASVAEQIKRYVQELCHIIAAEAVHQLPDAPACEWDAPRSKDLAPLAAEAKQALQMQQALESCAVTGDNAASLLYKFEQYLESVLAGRVAQGRPPIVSVGS